MKKYLALVKLLLVKQFCQFRAASSKADKRKRGGTIALYVLLALCFAPTVVAIAVCMYFMGKLAGADRYLGTFLLLMCQGLVLIFGVHSVISTVFVVKDADRLLFLPVRAHTVFLAKLTVAYINELITTAVAAIAVLLPFGLGASASAAYYVMLPVAALLIPMFPMLVGTLVAMPLSALVTAFGKNSLVKTILRIAIYVVIIGLYMFLMYQFGFLTGSENGNALDNPEVYVREILENLEERLHVVMPYFHPDFMLMTAMTAADFAQWIAGFAAALGENIALLGLVFLAALPFYRRMLVMSVEEGGSRRKKGNETVKMENRGVVREIMRVDLKKTVRDPQIGFQSFAGIVMMPILVVIIYFCLGISDEGDASVLKLISTSSLYQAIAPVVILAYIGFIGAATNVLGLYPISRENKSLSVLKSLPVPFNKVLLAKVLLATSVMAVCDLLTCVLIVALLGVKWYYGAAVLATMLLIGFGSMCITTLVDLKNPRLSWDNFSGLKNMKNSWLAMLVAFLSAISIATLSAPFIVLYALFGQWFWLLIMWLVDMAAGGAFAAIAYKVMTAKAAKCFEQIEI